MLLFLTKRIHSLASKEKKKVNAFFKNNKVQLKWRSSADPIFNYILQKQKGKDYKTKYKNGHKLCTKLSDIILASR